MEQRDEAISENYLVPTGYVLVSREDLQFLLYGFEDSKTFGEPEDHDIMRRLTNALAASQPTPDRAGSLCQREGS